MRYPILLLFVLTWCLPESADAQGCVIPPPSWTPPENPGPGDVVPPSTPGPSGPSSPGPSSPGPSTGSPSGPSTPGAGSPGPSSRGPSSPSSPGSPAGPSTPGIGAVTSLMSKANGLDSWQVWWLYNSQDYLDIKSSVYRNAPTTGEAEPFLGFGTEAEPQIASAPTDEEISAVVLTALLSAWKNDSSEAVRLACIAALSQVGDFASPAQNAEIAEILRASLKSGNRRTVEVSTAALGVIGRRELVPTLCEVLADSSRGRELCGAGEVPERVRAFAAYGLAVASQRDDAVDLRSYAQGKLIAALQSTDGRTPDLAVACVSALGILGEIAETAGDNATGESSTASGAREARLEALISILGDKKADRLVRAHVPRAIARQLPSDDGELRDRGVKAILKALDAREREVRYGCIQALGMIGDCDDDSADVSARRELLALAKKGDLFERNFARVALGEVAGRSGGPASRVADARGEIQSFLLRDLAGKKNQLRPWAAISLGVMAYGLREEGTEVSPSVTSALRLTLESAKSPEEVGALAIAIGLARDLPSADVLLAQFNNVSDDTTKGWLALGLGMVDARHTLDELREQLGDSLNRPGLMLNSSIALALLEDKSVIQPLIDNLLENSSSLVAASVARSLAYVGDRRAIAPLVATLDRKGLPDRTRSYAVIALGLVGDREVVPWTRSLTGHLNYMALTDSLHSTQDSGILNLR